MPTNPFVYKLSLTKGGSIRCQSKSANYHMAIVVFDTNNAIVFTGTGVGTDMKTANGATSVTIPASAAIKNATVIFLSHPVIAINASYTLETSVKDPTVTDRPYGRVVDVVSQDESATAECVVSITIN